MNRLLAILFYLAVIALGCKHESNKSAIRAGSPLGDEQLSVAENSALMQGEIDQIENDRSETYYSDSKSDEAKTEIYNRLIEQTKKLQKTYPNNAEPLIWQGILICSFADVNRSKALGAIKDAKSIFEKAITVDEKALHGAAYLYLGILYFKAPRLISFGDDEKAEVMFKNAKSINSATIEVNFFYGEYMEKLDKTESAISAYEYAIKIAPRKNQLYVDNLLIKMATIRINALKSDHE